MEPDHTITALAEGFPPASEAQWRALAEKALKGAAFDTLVSRTADDLAIAPLYTAQPGGTSVALTGSERPWQIVTLAGNGRADDEAALASLDLAQGADGIAFFAVPGADARDQETVHAILAQVRAAGSDRANFVLPLGGGGLDVARAVLADMPSWPVPAVRGRDSLSADPLGHLVATGEADRDVAGLMAALGSVMAGALSDAACPRGATVSANLYHDAGASEGQELAAMAGTLTAYLRAGDAAGLSPSQALSVAEIVLATDADFLLTIAKLRAARLIIAQIAEACGAAAAASAIRLRAVTSERMMAARDIYSNVLRTTIATAGAALGGADAITVLPHTHRLGQPDSFARRLARNTQLVLREESALGRISDPARGAFGLEALTRDLAAYAWKLFQEIEAEGGMAQALQSGLVQDQIRATAEARDVAIARGKQPITGVSAFPDLGEKRPAVTPWPLPDGLEDPAITVEPLVLRPLDAAFEALRLRADAYRARHGSAPLIHLCALGRLADFSARATFAQNFFATGGIAAPIGDGVETADAAVAAFKASGAALVCLCGSDADYARLAEPIAAALHQAGADHILLAGRPGDRLAAYRAAHIETFIYQGCDMVAVLRDALGRLTG